MASGEPWTILLQSPQDFAIPHSILFGPAAQVYWTAGWLAMSSFSPWLYSGSPPASSRSWPLWWPLSLILYPSTSSIPKNPNTRVSFSLNTHLWSTYSMPSATPGPELPQSQVTLRASGSAGSGGDETTDSSTRVSV